MVRFTSTERAKQGEEEDTAKFARGNRLSMAEQIRCYREECQRIFDLQNRVLSNPELLSTDEEDEEKSSEDEDEDGKHSKTTIGGIRISNLPSTQQSARNVQSLLSNKITSAQLHQKQEEAEREDLKRSVELGVSDFIKVCCHWYDLDCLYNSTRCLQKLYCDCSCSNPGRRREGK